MKSKPMEPVFTLVKGAMITPNRHLERNNLTSWQYAAEFPSHFATVAPGSILEIFEINRNYPVWVRAWLPHTHKTMHLKIGGEELSRFFHLVIQV